MKFTKDVSAGKKEFQDLPEKLLLKNGRLVDPFTRKDEKLDILIENGKIAEMGNKLDSNIDATVLDVKGKIIAPGFLDMHVHLREPGREDEETVVSGALAAANGGFTKICCMPNTDPPIDSQEIIQYIKDRAKGALIDVYPIAAITKKREGKELSAILELVEQGAVAISDDGSPVMSAEIMRRALEYSRMVDIPVIGHEEEKTMTEKGHINEGLISTCLGLGGIPTVAEDIMVGRDIMLSEFTGGRFHVAHISSKNAVDMVRQAKARGIAVTAEATPHHFTLTDEMVRGYDTNTKMHPPLRTEADREAIVEGLKDGTIDAIATDHAPHSWEEKASEYIYAPFGIVGLETAIGLAFTELYHTGMLTMNQLIEKFSVGPYQILNLKPAKIEKGQMANLTILDPDREWIVEDCHFLSRSSNSPFKGRKLKGKPFAAINNKQIFLSIL